jgi:putative flippase GtrA
MSSLSDPAPKIASIRTLIALATRFGLAGLINTGLGFAVIAGLDVGLHVAPPLANAAGYLVGMGVGFVLNRRFVFKSQAAASATAPRYSVVVIAAFTLNQLILRGVGAGLGPGTLQHLSAQLAGMVAYTAAAFLACRFWVFRQERTSEVVE